MQHGERKRKSFSGTTKAEVNKKMVNYVAAFDKMIVESDESKKTLEESMANWLKVSKFPSIERGSYDRLECTAKHQIYPILGKKVVGDVSSADVRKLLNHAAQGKENRPTCETVTTLTPEEIERFKAEAGRTWSNGERIYQQVAAYTLMFNIGLRTGEAFGLLNSDIDLEKRVIHVQRGVKEVSRRDGAEVTSGREVRVGKLKSTSSKRDVPLNQAAIDAILDLRAERYFGEDAPLIPDEYGGYTRPVNFRRRYYRILEAAGIEQKGLHSIRHTLATTLVNGVKQPDGTIKSLTPRQVADLLGHSTSEITEMYYVKKDTARLSGITEGFEL